jgi:hypothetical protein
MIMHALFCTWLSIQEVPKSTDATGSSEGHQVVALRAQERVIEKLTTKRLTMDDKAARMVLDDKQAVWLVDRRGRRVLVLMAVPVALRDRLQQEAWRGFPAR